LFEKLLFLKKVEIASNPLENSIAEILGKIEKEIQFNMLNILYEFCDDMKKLKNRKISIIFSKKKAQEFQIFFKKKNLEKIIKFE
jgi:hypothetical protein